jgi:hypothetical protein
MCACGRVGFDARGGDAPVPDVMIDAPPDAPPASLCATSGLVMCDGFETGTFRDPPWSSAFNIVTDSAHVYRGALAAHAHTDALPANANYPSAVIDNTNASVFGTNTAYLRAFLYYASGSAQTVLLSEVNPLNNDPTQVVKVFILSGLLQVETDTAAPTSTGVAMPTDRWTCFELAAKGSTTTSSNDAHATLWLDGTQLADVGSFNLSPSQQFVLGLNFYGLPAAPASDLWMDEVALDSARIGCSR